MKYYAMIEGERKGPFELDELIEIGVRPSTWVWAKGMTDWKRADEVGDICRLFRRRLAVLAHPQATLPAPPPAPQAEEKPQNQALRFWPEVEEKVDYDSKPLSVLPAAIFVTLMCFPLTGFVSIFYAVATGAKWKRSEDITDNPEERHRLRVEAHNASRLSQMWLGITIFLGMAFYGFLLSRTLL